MVQLTLCIFCADKLNTFELLPSEEGHDSSPLLFASENRVKSVSTPHGGTLTVTLDSYSYSYDPPGVASLLHNRYALGCAIFASLGGLTEYRAMGEGSRE
jgi:hypothetical protein